MFLALGVWQWPVKPLNQADLFRLETKFISSSNDRGKKNKEFVILSEINFSLRRSSAFYVFFFSNPVRIIILLTVFYSFFLSLWNIVMPIFYYDAFNMLGFYNCFHVIFLIGTELERILYEYNLFQILYFIQKPALYASYQCLYPQYL